MAKSPVAILFTTDGVEVGVKDGTALPANARGFIGVGYDGTDTQFILVDTSGRQRIIGAAAEGAAVAGDPLRVAGWDGTNLRTLRLYDADTGAGSEHVLGVVLRKSASGGSVELGTSADPVRTDPTGTTTQPVSDGGGSITVDGTVTANQGTAAAATAPWPVRASDGSAFINVALEHITAGSPHAVRLTDGSAFYDGTKTGQLPAALVGGRLDTNTGAWLGSTAPTVGQKTSANSIPIVVASDQSPIPVTVSAGTDRTSTGAITSTQDVAVSTQASGTCGVQVTGTWTGTLVFEATVDAGTTWNPVNAEVPTTGAEVTSTTANGVWVIAVAGYQQVRVRGNTVASGSATVYLTSSTATQVVILGDPLPAGNNNIGDVDVVTVPAPLSTTGGGTEATALRVTIANDSTGLVSVDDNGGSLTTDTPQLPGALVGGRLDTNIGAWMGATTPTVGQKAMTASLPVVIASDQSTLPIKVQGNVDAGNSSTTPLGISATFTGTGIDISSYAVITITVFADEDGTLKVEFSPDNTNWDFSLPYTIVGGAAERVQIGPLGRFFRVVYENGAQAQTVFRLQTIERTINVSPPVIPVEYEIKGSYDAILTKSVITGKTTSGGGAYVDVKVSPSGAVQVGGAVDQGTGAGAAGPWSVRLSDGSAFYDGTKTGQLPAALVGGRLDTNLGAWLGSTAPTVGQKTMANSVPIVIASDQTVIPVSQSGTWTVQQGTPPWSVVGAAADGAAPSGNPVLVAGQDGTNVQSLKTDTVGRPEVVGAAATGVAVAGAPVRVGGSDGTLTRDILTDTGGRQVVVGAAADGAAPVGDPVLGAGFDGTNVQTTLTDTSGRHRVVGAASDGSAVTGDPVLVGGQDGTNVQSLLTDTSGRALVAQPTASLFNATVTQGPAAALSGAWPVKITDGTNDADILVDNASASRLRTEGLVVDGETAAAAIVNTRRLQLVTGITRLVGGNNYGGVLDTDLWTASVTGSGSVTTGSGLATLANGGTANSTATLTTVATAQNVSGTLNEYFAGVQLADTGVANNTRTWGVADAIVPTNGLFFELSGTTFRLRFRNTSSDTTVNNGSFNGNYGATLTIDTNFHTWKLVYNAGTVSAFVDNKLLHTYTPTNQAIAGTVDFLLFAATTNSGGHATTQNLVVRGQSITRHGGTDTARLTDPLADTFIVPVVRTVVAGKNETSGNYVNVAVDDSGRLVVAPPSATATSKGFSNGEIVLASTTITAIRSTTYTEPSSGAQRSMASSSAADTSAGTGARTVRITYYTLSAGTVAGPFTETITLNGTGNVNTVATNICYIEKLEVLTVGSGGVNAGTISLFGATGGGGGTVWTIAVGINRTLGAHHYVPSGVTALITSFIGGIKGADTSGFIIRKKDPTDANSAEIQISDLLRAPANGSTPLRSYGTPIEVPGPSRITVFAVPDSSSSRTYYGSFDFYEQ